LEPQQAEITAGLLKNYKFILIINLYIVGG
jgi:hypothetical protein